MDAEGNIYSEQELGELGLPVCNCLLPICLLTIPV